MCIYVYFFLLISIVVETLLNLIYIDLIGFPKGGKAQRVNLIYVYVYVYNDYLCVKILLITVCIYINLIGFLKRGRTQNVSHLFSLLYVYY